MKIKILQKKLQTNDTKKKEETRKKQGRNKEETRKKQGRNKEETRKKQERNKKETRKKLNNGRDLSFQNPATTDKLL